jgi:hypothetical protein
LVGQAAVRQMGHDCAATLIDEAGFLLDLLRSLDR